MRKDLVIKEQAKAMLVNLASEKAFVDSHNAIIAEREDIWRSNVQRRRRAKAHVVTIAGNSTTRRQHVDRNLAINKYPLAKAKAKERRKEKDHKRWT